MPVGTSDHENWGKGWLPVSPLEKPHLFRLFAQLDGSEAAIKAFAEEFGVLDDGRRVAVNGAKQAGWGVYPVDSGHDTMITHPSELAEILLEIANK